MTAMANPFLTVFRMAPIVYKSEGKKIAERLWQETMAEFAFARAAEIVQELKYTASASA